jgi:fatty acid desaturase
MQTTTTTLWNTNPQEEAALADFRAQNPDLFQKDDAELIKHLSIVIGILVLYSILTISTPYLFFKVLFGAVSGFCWFSLINVTIHHHHTHKNAAASPKTKKILDSIYMIAMPSAPKRLSRYTRAHLNHHARPFHETDVDHHYGTNRWLRMMKKPADAILYFLELTFVGGHVPGWDDDRYMNTIPLEQWNQEDYERMKVVERDNALKTAAIQWGAFLTVLFFSQFIPFLGVIAWGWAFPMLLVKNWAHFLGQFQHYDPRFLEPSSSILKRTKTYRIPSWLNYLAGGELSGHFLHHLFPELPYYKVEAARKRLIQNPKLAEFAIY